TYGLELPISEARWLSRFTDASRLAATYRAGRIMVAGDAAHVHLPAGGPGISTGLHDEANLAWRLDGVLAGRLDEGTLDVYSEERRAAGARVMLSTRAQAALMAHSVNTPALRELFGELVTKPNVLQHLTDLVHGDDVRYGEASNPLVGRWMPEPVLMERPSVVLLDRTPDRALQRVAEPWLDELEVRAQPGIGVESILLRPDGYVAWAGLNGEGLAEALERCIGGAAGPVTRTA